VNTQTETPQPSGGPTCGRPPRLASNCHAATPGAIGVLSLAGLTPGQLLDRHFSGDWGDISDDDRAANDAALAGGSRILSAYQTTAGRVWCVTDAAGDDGTRELTTLLLPEEY
jgi:hypothetical protein